ncbi:MAG: hypothetical protein OSA38_07075 [Candidatus Poseidoniaceae archaeon]|nr:hypothetical protein [Candidatus Poseidoniaceae archaeon]
MKMPARLLALAIVTIFVGSVLTGFTAEMNPAMNENTLGEEPVTQQASSATSPGHVVFGQYISSDNCGHCSKTGGGSDAHHAIKGNHPDEYVYVTYMSASYGDTETARAGAVAPYNWAWSTGGAPKAHFGDRTDHEVVGASANYDTYDTEFSSGGGMAPTTNDYGMSASISQSGGTYDIDISYRYSGSASPASNMKLYAALVDKDCTGYTYSSGIPHGYNCWMAWLNDGDTYKAKGSGTGTSFASVTPTSSSQSVTWSSVPSSVVPGGINKAIVVGVLMAGNSVSVGGSSAHVYHAIDSTMGPKMDLTPGALSATNPAGSSSYMIGDTITLNSIISNVGDLDYSAGGDIEFFYKNGVNEVPIQTVSLNNIVMGSSQTAEVTFDTSSLPSNGWKTTFGVRLTGLVDETQSANNVALTELDHDRPPLAKKAQVEGGNVISRGTQFTILAKGDADDNVDTIDTLSFNIEVSPTGLNQWSNVSVSGGETILYPGSTSNEGREYVISPTVDMSAGWYDIRSQTVDSRGQTSGWMVTAGTDGFKLANGLPSVVAEPIPSVLCDVTTKVDMTGHVSDPETALADLVITSESPSFVAWYPATAELEVNFAWDEINGCPLNQQGMEIRVDDGGDYSESGELPYGTLLFNVLENGQPRWEGLPTQTIEEGGNDIINLLPFLSDTDDTGQSVAADTLAVSMVSSTNPDLIVFTLEGYVLGFEATDDDVNGQAIVTLRASDGEQISEQTMLVQINPANDAPRIDMENIETIQIKRNEQMVIDIVSRITDIDNPAAEAFLTVTPSEAGSARYNLLTGLLTLQFEQVGSQTVTLEVMDKYDTSSYTMDINVYDALPLTLSTESNGDGQIFADMSNTYIGQTPTMTMTLMDGAPVFTYISVTWNVCNDLTGTCDGLLSYELDVSKSSEGWVNQLEMASLVFEGQSAREDGSRDRDYYELEVLATDDQGEDYKTLTKLKWRITETAPTPAEMDEMTFFTYLADLTTTKSSIEETIAGSTGDTTELEADLATIETQLDAACNDPRAECQSDSASGATSELTEGLPIETIGFAVIGVIIALLIGLLMTRGKKEDVVENWNTGTVPANDMVANSMYGGAQEIFQAPAPVIPQQVAAGPQLPATGLPAGWTMEQWAYYGQQYLDDQN